VNWTGTGKKTINPKNVNQIGTGKKTIQKNQSTKKYIKDSNFEKKRIYSCASI
jgi:hypothetical protein